MGGTGDILKLHILQIYVSVRSIYIYYGKGQRLLITDYLLQVTDY